jgi:kinesin family protein C2/C3
MSSVDWGVNYRALHDLFHMTQSRHEVFSMYEVGVQMLEIYNEQVRDLLAVDGVQKKISFLTIKLVVTAKSEVNRSVD